MSFEKPPIEFNKVSTNKKILSLVFAAVIFVGGIYFSLLGGLATFGHPVLALIPLGGILASFIGAYLILRKFWTKKFAFIVLIGMILVFLGFFGFLRF